jgi:hypothetical protein
MSRVGQIPFYPSLFSLEGREFNENEKREKKFVVC